MYPEPIQNLIKVFLKFPTVGIRTATRFVLYLTKAEDKEIEELVAGISNLKEKISLCSLCFNPFYKNPSGLCEICSDPRRDKSLLCIVEREVDLMAIEKTKKYNGLYFILGGTFSPLNKKTLINSRLKSLQDRLSEKNIKEVLIATNLTAEGETTALFIERVLKDSDIKTTRLGRGLQIGSELEYADSETLTSALEGRK